MKKDIRIFQYWGGCPYTQNSKWQRFLHLAEKCSRQGWTTHMVWSKMPDKPALWKPFLDSGCEIIILPRPARNFDLSCVWQCYGWLRKLRCRIFHCHNVHTSPMIAAALAGVPVRLWSKLSMSSHYETGIPPTGVHRLSPSVRVSSRLAHRVLALSNAVRDELLAEQGLSPDKVCIVPGPIDIMRYAGNSQNGVREKLGLDRADTVLTTVGRAMPVKGWDTLIHAFSRIVPLFPSAKLLLVGSKRFSEEAEFGEKLDKLVHALDLTDRVFFLGQREDIPDILQASDVFVFPSRSDGQGLALVEALAAGLPCVAARVGGITDTIEHRSNGLLFEREDVNGLTENLVRVLQDKTLSRNLRSNALKSVQKFDLDKVTDQVLGIYESLIKSTGAK